MGCDITYQKLFRAPAWTFALSAPPRTCMMVPRMFANLLQLLNRQLTSNGDDAFVREVRVHHRVSRNRRSEQLLLWGWILIGVKSVAMFWLVDRYAMPFNAWWIVAPTLIAAAVCTWVYLKRNRG